MSLCPFAEWRPSPNFGHDGKPKIGLIVHHMDSSLSSADGWFHNPSSSASAHFGVGYDGHTVQWVDTDDVAYAQCQGNWQGWVSVENESDPARPNDPPTPAQIAAMGRILAWLGTPPVPATSMYSGGVGYHRQFPGDCSVAWGQTSCPGDGFVAAIPAICAAAGGASTAEEGFLMALSDQEQHEILDYVRSLRDGTPYTSPLLSSIADTAKNVGPVAAQYGVLPVTNAVAALAIAVKKIATKVGA